jgi:putative FmdB family regulatory protein
MPIYEFRCMSCDHKFDELCGYGEEYIKCPMCGWTAERVMSVFAANGTDNGHISRS